MSIPTTYTLDTPVVEVLVTEALRFGDTDVRQPDAVDPVTGSAFWIGDYASVEVPFEHLHKVAMWARDWCPLRRPEPKALGVCVELFDPTYEHPAFRGTAKAHERTVWATFAETLTAH